MQMKTRAAMMTEIAIRNVDSRQDPFADFEEDHKKDDNAVYNELIRIGCPIWKLRKWTITTSMKTGFRK